MPALLVSLDGHASISLDRNLIVVGRSHRCDARLDLPYVSGRHCVFVRDGDGLVVIDLGSTNGTRINGRLVDQGRLVPGDEVQIARMRFRLEGDRDRDHLGVRPASGPSPVGTMGDHGLHASVEARPGFMRGRSMRTTSRRGLLCLGILAAGIVLGRQTAPAHDASATVSDRLYFGRAIPGGGSVSEEAWATFLHEVVTPRFPEGLTVWSADGQWTDSLGRVVRERVNVVEVLHPASARADSALAEIAREYKRRFRQEVVLGASAPARIQFHE